MNDQSINDQFEVDSIFIPDSEYNHYMTTMANYRDFPLILGGSDNVKLESLDTEERSLRWNGGTEYPYQRNKLVLRDHCQPHIL